MTPRLVACTKCRAPLPPVLYNSPELHPCPSCGTRVLVDVFPAALRPPGPGASAEAVLIDGEASCFYHPSKKAILPCEGCGRFLCAVCDVEMNGHHFCPACLESGKKKGKLTQLENRRALHDNTALQLSILPVFFTAPIGLYMAIRYWNTPTSVVPRGKWRFVLAIILSLGQIALAVGLIVSASHSHR